MMDPYVVLTDSDQDIPKAEFITSIDEFFKSKKAPFESVFVELQRKIEKYKNIEIKFSERKKELENNLSQLDHSLDSIAHLKSKKDQESECEFELAPGLYASASYNNVDVVYLWLGVGLMVEYPIDEAIEVLNKNKKETSALISKINNKIEFIKEQVVITQVSMTRIHNWRLLLKLLLAMGYVKPGSKVAFLSKHQNFAKLSKKKI